MNSIFIKSDEIFTALIVAICEEYLFRYVAFHILFKEYQTFFTIIVTSLLFGLLLHILLYKNNLSLKRRNKPRIINSLNKH